MMEKKRVIFLGYNDGYDDGYNDVRLTQMLITCKVIMMVLEQVKKAK